MGRDGGARAFPSGKTHGRSPLAAALWQHGGRTDTPTDRMDSTLTPLPRPTLIQRLAAACLRLFGWKAIGRELVPAKSVLVVYPHTSNWDFPLGVLTRAALGLQANWIGKDSLFRWPFAGFMRALGGIPVDRRNPAGFVEQMIALYPRYERLNLAIAPEGTRSRRPGWKSGFYRIALGAGVPVSVASIDYAHREAGMLGSILLTGDRDADMARIAALFEGRRGKRPELASPLILLDGDRRA